ncbi:MAG TPA: hypothetical protein VHC69_19360 [Polyangiaceae bacterium]|nr:hypothetical protein [Polyangiaceae bacterium]
MKSTPISSILLAVLGALSFSTRSAAADNFKNSPVANGDNNYVEVRYDQRVTNNVEHKHFVIYRGPSATQIKTLLQQVLDQDLSIQWDLQANREQAAFDKIHEALEARMTAAQISLDGLTSKLEALEVTVDKTKKYVEQIEDELTYPAMFFAAAVGWVGDASLRRWSNGLMARVGLDFVLGSKKSHARSNLVLSASFDGAQSDQIFLAPNGAEIDRTTATSSYRLGGDVGYALALGSSWQIVPYAALGGWAQWFVSAVTKDLTATVGLRAGLETRIGSFRKGFRLGAEYSLQSLRQPTYDFRGLSIDSSPDRETVNSVRLYLGGYWGLI